MILVNDSGARKISADFTIEINKSYIIDLSTLSANITASLPSTSTLEIGDYFEIHTLKSGSYNLNINFIGATQPFESASTNKTITASGSFRFIYIGGTFGWKLVESAGGGKIVELDVTKACEVGNQFMRDGIVIECITKQSAGFTFSWANFKPILGGSYVWKGVFNATSTYAVNDVVVSSTTSSTLYVCNTAITVASADYEPVNGVKRGYFSPTNLGVLNPYTPSTDTLQGQQGLVPSSMVGSNNFILKNNAGWQPFLSVAGTYSAPSLFNQATTTIPFDSKIRKVDLTTLNANGYMYLTDAKTETVGGMIFLQKTDNTAFAFTIKPQVGNVINDGLVAEIQLSSKGEYVLLIVDAVGSIRILSKSATGLTVPTIQTLTASGTVTDWASIVKADASALSSNLIATLPSAKTFSGKSITIQKMDNSNNAIVIVPNGTEKLNDSTNPMYLYNQYDTLTVYSDGANTFIYNDSRQGTGSTASSARFKRTALYSPTFNGGANGTGTPVIFTDTESILGTNISLNTTTGVITLKGGSTYNITASPNGTTFNTSNGYAIFELVYSIDNGSTWVSNFSSRCVMTSASNATYGGASSVSKIKLPTTTETLVKYVVLEHGGLTGIGSSNISGQWELPWIEIEEASRQATVLNTVDTLYAIPSSIITSVKQIPLTKINGNLNINSYGGILLKSGKAYNLTAFMAVRSTYCTYEWRDFTGVTNPDATLTGTAIPNATYGGSISASSTDSMSPTPAFLTITPSSDMEVRLVLTGILGANTMNVNSSFVSVQQIGSTGVNSIDSNLITGGAWQSYTPTITCPTTSFHLVNTYTMKGLYRVVGKNMQLKFIYSHTNNTGFNEGTSSVPYQISIPNSYQIDTTKANIPSSLLSTTGNGAGIDALPLGTSTFYSSSAPVIFTGKVVPLSTTTLGIHHICMNGTITPFTLWGSGNSYYGGSTVELSFEINIPLL